MREKHTVRGLKLLRVVAPAVVQFSCASGSCLKSSTVASLWNLTAHCHLDNNTGKLQQSICPVELGIHSQKRGEVKISDIW